VLRLGKTGGIERAPEYTGNLMSTVGPGWGILGAYNKFIKLDCGVREQNGE